MVVTGIILELLPDEHILLMDGIPFAKCLGKGCQQMCELIVTVDVS